jgi:cystinosin
MQRDRSPAWRVRLCFFLSPCDTYSQRHVVYASQVGGVSQISHGRIYTQQAGALEAMVDSQVLIFLSAVFGWVYTICWSASFYPQPLLNYRRKSTSGTTVDFPFINCLGMFSSLPISLDDLEIEGEVPAARTKLSRPTELTTHYLRRQGFLAYFVSNAFFYYSPLIRDQYAQRNRGLTPTVQFNDLTFAAHALLLSCITTSQYWLSAWKFAPSAGTGPSRLILGVAYGCVVAVLIIAFLVLAVDSHGRKVDARTSWCALDVVYAISYVKLFITLIKYGPQIAANYKNRSTKGWSIGQILLDLTGGILSIAQQAIDSYLQHDWSGITGNPVKFALGNVSMLYDFVFITQHYVLYRGHSDGKAGERDALLEDGAAEDRRLD